MLRGCRSSVKWHYCVKMLFDVRFYGDVFRSVELKTSGIWYADRPNASFRTVSNNHMTDTRTFEVIATLATVVGPEMKCGNIFENAWLMVRNFCTLYSRITFIKSLSFCMTTFSASLTSVTVLLPQSRDCSCYVSGPILTPPPLWLHKHTDLRAHDFAHSPDFWHQPRLANLTCTWIWRLCGINFAVICTFSDLFSTIVVAGLSQNSFLLTVDTIQ
jgi:hypothetical protein